MPLVVALCDAGFIRDFHASIERILLGEPHYGVTRDANGEVGVQIARTGQAALFTTRAADPALSAVVSVDSRLFDEGVFLGLELWHHPFAAHPLPAGSFGEIVEHTATRIGEDVWDVSPAQQNETELPVELGLARREA